MPKKMNLKNTMFWTATFLLIVGVALTPGLVGAQEEEEEFVLDDVVVTAQRRVENLQTLPISATALDGEALNSKAVDRLFDLQLASPSLSITQAGQTQSANIRGIGLASNSPDATAGVAIYVDGLFQPPIVQSNSFYDLSSVEVLRGPQGTFVGTNSTGGAIFINSRNPEFEEFGGYARIGAGNFGAFNAEGAINIPVAETLAFRVAGFSRNRDSYYHDVGPFNNDAGKLDEKGGRLGVLWQPGSFSALLKLSMNDLRNGGFAFRPIVGTDFEPGRVGDIWTLSYDADVSHREKADIHSLDLKYELSNGVVLRSLSGYQRKRMYSFDDIDATQLAQITWDYFAEEKQYSEEINIISPTDGAFDWILGGYLQKNEIDVRIYQKDAGFPTDILVKNERKTTGIFAQGNYQLTNAVELQLGGRYSTYEVTGPTTVAIGNGIPIFPPGGLLVVDFSGFHEDSKVTGKAAINWTLDSDNLLYVFAARGYKPGGFNSGTSEFEPETVWNYELGWKSTSLLQGRLRTQVALFYNDYNGFQMDGVEPSTGEGGVYNLANATIKGVEAQVEGVFGQFAFDTGAAYVDSELDAFTYVNTRLLPPGTLGPQCPPGVPSNPPFCFDYGPYIQTNSGGSNLYSPEWTFNVGAQYAFLLGNMSLTPRVNYSYVGERYTYIAYSPVTDVLESHGVVSALLTLQIGSWDAWSFEIYGTNLTDEEYVAGQASSSNNEFYGAPREYGFRVNVEF